MAILTAVQMLSWSPLAKVKAACFLFEFSSQVFLFLHFLFPIIYSLPFLQWKKLPLAIIHRAEKLSVFAALISHRLTLKEHTGNPYQVETQAWQGKQTSAPRTISKLKFDFPKKGNPVLTLPSKYDVSCATVLQND